MPETPTYVQVFERAQDPERPIWVYAARLGAGDWSPDRHMTMEIGMVLDGRHDSRLDGGSTWWPGDIWLRDMWEPHEWRISSPTAEILSFMFMPEAIDRRLFQRDWREMFIVPVSQRPRVTESKVRDAVLRVASEVWRAIIEQTPSRYALIYLGLHRLLVEMDCHWSGPVKGAEWRDHFARIRPALELVDSHPGERISAAHAAHICGLSRSHFDALFRELIKMPFGRYMTRTCVGLACQQLLWTDLSVEVIARTTGFVDASHLHRNFVRFLGCTPAQYRRSGPMRGTGLLP